MTGMKSLFACLLFSSAAASAPLDVARRIADRVVDHTRFEFEYVVRPTYPDAETVDFGRSCQPGLGVAYAITTLHSESDQEQTFEVGCRGALKIWIDDSLVYNQAPDPGFAIRFDEKKYWLPGRFTVHLREGDHTLLVKTQSCPNGEWVMAIQSQDMSRYHRKGRRITCSLKTYAPKINLAHWLVAGTFDGDIATPFPPETKLEFHRVWESGSRRVTWNIPRVDILTDNPGGGKFYNWSYHVGCFVWGLQRLSAVTGERRYAAYADRWCDYSFAAEPLADFQTRDLLAVRSMNFGQIGRPMLDYVSAPAMPYVTRLACDPDDFPGRDAYRDKAERVVEYLLNEQFRIRGVFGRTYTELPSVWADDMFMGLPYLVYMSRCDASLRARLLDDASAQLIGFHDLLFDPAEKLYRQACYPDRPEVKVPFWSRGNGWALWAACEVLEALPEDHGNHRAVMDIFRRHIDGIVARQDNDGFWRNVLDVDASVRESSGAAIFTMALARGINNGWIDRAQYAPPLEKAWEALLTFIDVNGDMSGVKGGTNFSEDWRDYERVPFIKSDTHGLLPVLFACIEMDLYLTGPM